MNIYDFLENYRDKENIIIVECGGHIGQDTVKIAKLLPKCKLHTIEANPTTFDNYLKNLNSTYSNISVYNHGLSNNNCEKSLYVEPDGIGDQGACSLQGRATPYGVFSHLRNGEKEIKIQCKTLDKFIFDNSIDKIDFLWLDVEQHEYEILNSCSKETLAKIGCIYTEVSFKESRENGKLYQDIKYLLEKNNFKELQIYNFAQNHGCDVLFQNIFY